jgi:hypothetical protein
MTTRMAKQKQRNELVHREVVQVVQKMEKRKVEHKFLDTAATAATVTSTAALVNLSTIVQGITVNDRIGRDVRLHHLEMSYTLYQQNVNVLTSVRVVIFQWKPNTQALVPTYAQVFETTTGSAFLASYNYDYSDQYSILYDKLHSLAGLVAAPTASSNQNVLLRRIRNMRQVQVYVAGTSNSSNSLYLLYISDVAANAPTFNYQFRLDFTDE